MSDHGAYNGWCRVEGIPLKAEDCIDCLRADLRAALATRPQPLFEGKFEGWQAESIVALVRWDGDPRWDLPAEPIYGQRVVVYAAVAGSATPTEENDDASD
jgi:hypothetical protein